jgi:signal transduction histidine kinase
MQKLRQLIVDHETWLMERILFYAKRHDYTQYTSTLLEAWRLSIAGISDSIFSALDVHEEPPEMGPDEDFTQDPVAAFGMLEAQRHRHRGITLSMFMGLMKYYRQSYIDLIREAGLDPADEAQYRLYIDRCFDRLEIGYCTAWASLSGDALIEDLQRTNRDMTNEKNRYLTIFESLHDPVILFNVEGRIMNANAAAVGLFQDTALDASSAPGSLYYHAADPVEPLDGAQSPPALVLPWLTARMAALRVSDDQEITFEETVDTYMGRRTFVVKLKKMLDVSDKFSGTVVILNDVTEARMASQALQASHTRLEETLLELQTAQAQMLQQERLAAIGQLAAGVAHEFNNMMAPVILYSDMLRHGIPLPASERKKLEVIGGQGRRASELTQQILDFSRQSVLKRQSVNLVNLIESVQQLLVHTLPESIKVRLSVTPHEVIANLDPTRIQQALMNLAFNARDAMPDGGTLTLKVDYLHDDTPQAIIAVSDTGAGIADDVLPHIFEPFFTTKAVGQGTGLGLPQVYGIVVQHQGEIDVATEVGRGTTVTMCFPAMALSGIPSRAPAAIPAQNYLRGSGETILVVEDDEVVLQALVAALEMLDYRTVKADNGEAARAILEQRDGAAPPIDLVLSDLVMTPLGGDGLAAWMDCEAIGVPIVVLTGFPLDKDKMPQNDCVYGWLQKPIDLEELSQVVAKALGR